jgi:hypothetical protein
MDLIIPSAKNPLSFSEAVHCPSKLNERRSVLCPLSLRMENEPFMHQGVNPFR